VRVRACACVCACACVRACVRAPCSGQCVRALPSSTSTSSSFSYLTPTSPSPTRCRLLAPPWSPLMVDTPRHEPGRALLAHEVWSARERAERRGGALELPPRLLAARMVEPYAYAKLATRGDVLAPFYITDQHVKAKDASGVPTKIEIVLGRLCAVWRPRGRRARRGAAARRMAFAGGVQRRRGAPARLVCRLGQHAGERVLPRDSAPRAPAAHCTAGQCAAASLPWASDGRGRGDCACMRVCICVRVVSARREPGRHGLFSGARPQRFPGSRCRGRTTLTTTLAPA
jgi:hypothetical protein